LGAGIALYVIAQMKATCAYRKYAGSADSIFKDLSIPFTVIPLALFYSFSPIW
jgi:hypothetical protein